MSDEQYADILDLEESSEGWAKLRDAHKKDATRIQELEAALEKIQTDKRQADIESAVSAAGLPPAAVELAVLQVKDPADLPKWLEEKREKFGVSGVIESENGENSRTPEGQSALPADQLAQLQAMQGIQPGAFVPGSLDAFEAHLDGATSKADFYQRLNSGGAPSA